MASMQMCGATVTKRTANIITAVGSVGALVGTSLIITAIAVGCQYYRYIDGIINYYKTDCTIYSILIITGSILLCSAVPVAVTGCVMLCSMRKARSPAPVPVTLHAPVYNVQLHPQQGVGQLHPQHGTGQPYQQQGIAPPYPQRAATPSYPQQETVPSYPQQETIPSYPQRAATTLYPQQETVPPYPQRAATPSYPQQEAVPSNPSS
nr:integumentary mucin A.1-like [Penaeus vannamei]